MKFDDRTLDHLRGRSFSNALRVAVDDPEPVVDRISLLVELCRGKRVIDLGFADHVELIAPKTQLATWLHASLAGVAERCLGIDISEAGVARARQLGYTDVAQTDVTAGPITETEMDTWDLLVLGEVLEHVDNPVTFLAAIRERYVGRLARLVLTVPNAFDARNFLGAMRGWEVVNSDHRFWFTPYTLAKVVQEAGLTPEWFRFCESFPRQAPDAPIARLRQTVAGVVKTRIPALRPDLVMSALIAR